MSLPRAYLSQKLTQPLPTKDGAVLRTIGEAALRAGAAARGVLRQGEYRVDGDRVYQGDHEDRAAPN
jgi:hypothetical protein